MSVNIGDRHGKLTVKSRAPDLIYKSGKRKAWYCDCDCGTKNVIVGSNNINTTKSCGCLISESRRKYNQYDLSGEYGIGYTRKNEPFYFDLEDYDKIKDYCWRINPHGYVICRDLNNKDINHPSILWMHDIIMDLKYIDHIGGRETRNDNRKCNLRTVDGDKGVFYSFNNINKRIQNNNTSGIVGVSYNNRNNKWRAYINYNYKRIELGHFDCKEEAIKARKDAEEKFFKEWSYNNSQKKRRKINAV